MKYRHYLVSGLLVITPHNFFAITITNATKTPIDVTVRFELSPTRTQQLARDRLLVNDGRAQPGSPRYERMQQIEKLMYDETVRSNITPGTEVVVTPTADYQDLITKLKVRNAQTGAYDEYIWYSVSRMDPVDQPDGKGFIHYRSPYEVGEAEKFIVEPKGTFSGHKAFRISRLVAGSGETSDKVALENKKDLNKQVR